MNKVRVRIDGRLRMPVGDVPERMLEQMRIRFSYPSPESGPPIGRMAGEPRPDWCAVVEEAGHYCVPRGLLDALRSCAQGCDVQLQYESRVCGSAAVPCTSDEDWAIRPRPYQREIVNALVEKVQGYVVLPCGGGKTTAGVAAILRVGQPALVLVGSTDLLDQWADTVTRASAGTIKPRRVGGGTRPDFSPLRPGEVAVAMVQVLADEPAADPLLRSVAVLLADEVHHIASRSWSEVTNRCPARWRWGLTATPDRADGWGFLLRVLLGPCLYTKTARELVDLGYLRTPTIIPVSSAWLPGPAEHRWAVRCPACGYMGDHGWNAWQGGRATCTGRVVTRGKRVKCGLVLPPTADAQQSTLDWSATSSALGADPARQALLGALAGHAVKAGRKVLVLVGRKATLDPVAGHARVSGGGQVAVVASGVGGREGIIARLKNGRTDVLVATQLADEGLDVPDLDCVVLGQPGKDGGKAKQRTGRTTRPHGQPPVVFDVVDGGGVLRAQWRSRRRAYEAEYGPGCLAARDPVSLEEALLLMGRV